MNMRAIRSELHIHLNSILLDMGAFISKETKVLFKPNKKALSFTVVPLTPTIFELFKGELQHKEMLDSERKLLFSFSQTRETILGQRYSLYIMKTIESIAMRTMKNCYAANRGERIALRTKIWMDKILNLLEDRSDENKVVVDYVSSLTYNVLSESSSALASQFKKVILDIFSADEFFNCSCRSLKYWREIINWTVHNNRSESILSLYLNK